MTKPELTKLQFIYKHVIREQNLQGKCSQLAAGPFHSCRN